MTHEFDIALGVLPLLRGTGIRVCSSPGSRWSVVLQACDAGAACFLSTPPPTKSQALLLPLHTMGFPDRKHPSACRMHLKMDSGEACHTFIASANLAVPERAIVPRLERMSSRDMPTPVSLQISPGAHSAHGAAIHFAHTLQEACGVCYVARIPQQAVPSSAASSREMGASYAHDDEGTPLTDASISLGWTV